MNKILIILYTLCGSPAHFTVQEGMIFKIYPATMEVARQLDQQFKGKEIMTVSLPLDKVQDGVCI